MKKSNPAKNGSTSEANPKNFKTVNATSSRFKSIYGDSSNNFSRLEDTELEKTYHHNRSVRSHTNETKLKIGNDRRSRKDNIF